MDLLCQNSPARSNAIELVEGLYRLF